MKLYSKKYLAMLLAGVMVTSMPVAAFAGENENNKPTESNNKVEEPKDNNKNKTSNNEEKNKDGNNSKPEENEDKNKDKEDKYEKELEDKKEDAKDEVDDLKNLSRYERDRIKNKIDRAGSESEVESILRDAKYDNDDNRKGDISKRDLDITKLKYDGKRVTGKTLKRAEIHVSIDNGRFKYETTADSDGEFDFKLDLKKGEKAEIRAEKDDVTGNSETIRYNNFDGNEVKVTNLEISGRKLSGHIRDHKWEDVKIYLNGKYLATARTDKDGDFSVTLDERLSSRDLDDLTFYIEKSTNVENKDLKITRAIEGEKLVMGTTKGLEEVRVLSGGKELGKGKAVRTGDFTVYLDRALTSGEKLTLESKDEDGKVSKIDFTVSKKSVSEKKLSYIDGYPDGTFKPSANMTRAEATKMIAVLVNDGSNFGTSKTTKFKDANDDWYSEAINYVVQKGFIDGYSDGTFKPNAKITRAEFAKMISGYIKDNSTSKDSFADTKDHWAKDAIDKLYGNKNIKGYPDGSFKPNEDITRAEAVTILNSVFNRNTTSSSLQNVDKSRLKTFSDVDTSHWAYYNIIDASNTHTSEKVNGNSDAEVWK